jgi:hypothetical protein
MPFETEKKLYDALKGFLSIRHRIDGCGDPNCLVCAQNSKVQKDAQDAVREFEDRYGIDDIPF